MKQKNIWKEIEDPLELNTDSRGSIVDVFYNSKIDHVAVIKSNPDSIRGNHYHKYTTQHILITSGSLEYWYKDLNSKNKAKKILVKKGDFISTPPYEIHALKIGKEGNEFIVFSEGQRGGKDYESDTFRVKILLKMSFEKVRIFENKIADFFGAPYAVAVDSCTHGIELCLRLTLAKKIKVPSRTYLSIPFLAKKLNIDLEWSYEKWNDFYFLTDQIADAAVLWKRIGIKGKYMCISFQYQKHLSLGRGGIILCPNKADYSILKKMSYDGRMPEIAWRDQNIDIIGYHYYMTPETAKIGLDKLKDAIISNPKKWNYEDWPDLTKMKIFNES